MFKTVKDLSFIDKRVLVRCDFNVPLDEEGNILDDFRIQQSLETINYLLEKGARVILMSHLGEPEGKIIPILKMDKIAKRLSEYLNIPVLKEDDCIGPAVESATYKLSSEEILLLENLRFHKEETEGDSEFARKLSFLGEVYVNEAFSVCHRNHSSITGVPRFLPSCAGLLLEREIQNLDKVLTNPERPMVALVGGKKVETKSKFINKISEIADFVIISGLIKKEILDKNIQLTNPQKIIAPLKDLEGKDVDEDSLKIFEEKILLAKTIVWNGPFGKFEEDKFKRGTLRIAQAVIQSGAFSVVGGGETVEFLRKENIINKFSHVSTGGGAMLAYLSGERLPGLEALSC